MTVSTFIKVVRSVCWPSEIDCHKYIYDNRSQKANIHVATFVARHCCATKVASCFELFHTQLLSRNKWQKGISLFSYTLLYKSKRTQLRKIDNKCVVGAFSAIMAVLVLCESADGEEIVVIGQGNAWVRRQSGFRIYHRLIKQDTGIFTYGCGHFWWTCAWPWSWN